jgi:hypothetical protein
MARKKEKEIIHKPDILVQAFDSVSTYIRVNTRQCLYGLGALIVVVALVVSYAVYAHYQDQKIQYQLAQGIKTVEMYGQTRAPADIDKAEVIFQRIASSASGKSRYIAKLYLANINLTKGKREEAIKLYQEVAHNSSNQALTYLADKAIKSIEKK